MMNQTDTLTDDLTSLEFETVCDLNGKGTHKNLPICGNSAEWILVKSCCGAIRLYCDTHTKFFVNMSKMITICMVCQTISDPHYRSVTRL